MSDIKELNEKDIENVSGGISEALQDLKQKQIDGMTEKARSGFKGYFHLNCGGIIDGVMNIFAYCHCRKCDEEHYFANGFAKYKIYENSNDYSKVYEDGHEVRYASKPEELDYPCNQ